MAGGVPAQQVIVSAKFDSARTGSGVVAYSLGDKRVDHNGTTTRVNCRTLSPIGSAPVYFEFLFGGGSSSTTEPAFGLAVSSLAETASPSLANAWALLKSGLKQGQGANTAGYTRALVVGDVIGIAANPTTGNMWFSLNGVWIGDPVAGTSPAFTNITSALYPYVAMRNSSAAATPWVLGKFAPSEWSYPAPSGYNQVPD